MEPVQWLAVEVMLYVDQGLAVQLVGRCILFGIGG